MRKRDPGRKPSPLHVGQPQAAQQTTSLRVPGKTSPHACRQCCRFRDKPTRARWLHGGHRTCRAGLGARVTTTWASHRAWLPHNPGRHGAGWVGGSTLALWHLAGRADRQPGEHDGLLGARWLVVDVGCAGIAHGVFLFLFCSERRSHLPVFFSFLFFSSTCPGQEDHGSLGSGI